MVAFFCCLAFSPRGNFFEKEDPVIKTMTTQLSRISIAILALVISLISVDILHAQQRRIFATTTTLDQMSNEIVEFDEANGVLNTLETGTTFRASLAALGDTILTLDLLRSVSEYDLDGNYLGEFLEPQPQSYDQIETDKAGNVYLNGSNGALRLNSEGGITLQTPRIGNLGIDADAAGNIYIGRNGSGPNGMGTLTKLSPSGQVLAESDVPFLFVGDLTIDEANQRLYVAEQPGGMAVFDISTPTPTLENSFELPWQTTGVSFDEASGNVLVGSLSFQLFEVNAAGDIVNSFFDTTFFEDVVSIPVPEPASGVLLIGCSLFACLIRRRS